VRFAAMKRRDLTRALFPINQANRLIWRASLYKSVALDLVPITCL
jgi:hypothetical protein